MQQKESEKKKKESTAFQIGQMEHLFFSPYLTSNRKGFGSSGKFEAKESAGVGYLT